MAEGDLKASPKGAENKNHPWLSTLDNDNLTGLTELNQEILLDAIKNRYQDDFIYTDVGDILVAVNPFCSLPLYTTAWSGAFNRPDLSGMAPHIFKSAARAYNAMIQAKTDQVCVISGESGAGKTESAKLIMRQVMEMSRPSSSSVGQTLQHRISQLNPILEAFGNAKTALNDNSSRFGKFIQLIFDPSGRIVGAGLEQYLLEKSRICVQGDLERNFHIFYYMYAGLDQDLLNQLQLKKPTEHRYLKNFPLVMQECSSPINKELFNTAVDCMLSIGFAKEEIQEIYSILAAIILIGDIEFEGADGTDDNAIIKNPESAKLVDEILGLENYDDLCFALTTLRTETRGEAVDKRYKCSKAADVRDALAKALYARLFQWIVTRLNSYLQPDVSKDHINIGILDIFGFENFEKNSFEQFCINLANEQLQCYFNHQIFAMEKVELMKEGLLTLENISYTDNKPVLDMFLNKPIGLLSLLDEQCRGFNGTEKAFVQRCKDCFRKHSSYTPDKGNRLQFTIHHYAGQVLYTIEGFLEKNKDSLPDTLVDSIKYCNVALVRTLFRRSANPNSGLKKSILRKSQRSVMRAMSRKSIRIKKSKGRPQKALTVSGHFQQSLKELMERIFAASPHFIRCIKPNYEKSPRSCDDTFMLKQLMYTGMLEAVRVRREGFSFRPHFSDFFNTYRSVAYYSLDKEIRGSEAACQVILEKAELKGWQMGKSRVFLRYFHEEKLNLMLKNMEDKAIQIQKLFRGWRTRKWTTNLKENLKKEKIMASSFLSTMNIHGKECVDTLIGLTKTDILLVKERFRNVPKPSSISLSSSESFKALTDQEKKVRKIKELGVRLIPSFSLNTAQSPKNDSDDSTEEEEEEEEEPNEEAEEDVTSMRGHSPTKENEADLNIIQSQSPAHLILAPITPLLSPLLPQPETETRHVTPPIPHPRNPRQKPRSQNSDRLSSASPPRSPTPVPRPRYRNSDRFSSASPPRSPTPVPRTRSKVIVNPQMKPIPKPRRNKAQVKGELKNGSVADRTSIISSPERNGSQHNTRSHIDDTTSLDKQSANTNPSSLPSNVPSQKLSPDRGGDIPVDSSLMHPDIINMKIKSLSVDCLFDTDTNGMKKRCHSDSSPVNHHYSPLLNSAIAYKSPERKNNELQETKSQLSILDEQSAYTNPIGGGVSGQKASPDHGGDILVDSSLMHPDIKIKSLSVDCLFDTDTNGIKKRCHSDGNPVNHHHSPLLNSAIADKRVKKRWRRSGNSRECSPSYRLSIGVSGEEEEESDLDTLALCPSFNKDNAMDHILGQPKGTYTIYKDDIELRQLLMVSLGQEGVRSYPIKTTRTHGGGDVYLGNIDISKVSMFSHLRALVDHYRSNELSTGLKLNQPYACLRGTISSFGKPII